MMSNETPDLNMSDTTLDLPDWVLVVLYRHWSEETYAVVFMVPDPAFAGFRQWLNELSRRRNIWTHYEGEFLRLYHEAEKKEST